MIANDADIDAWRTELRTTGTVAMGERANVDEPDGVEFVGAVSEALFPNSCLKCGRPSSGVLPIAKMFRRPGIRDRPSYFVFGQASAPFCASCIAIHKRERQPIAGEVRRRLLWQWAGGALPFIFPLGVALWMVGNLAPALLEALAPGGEWWELPMWGAVVGFFCFLALMFFNLIRDRGRGLMLPLPGSADEAYMQVERGPLGSCFHVPVEPTSVQGALDFTDDISQAFDGERHLFTFENREVQALFAQINAGHNWNPASSRARLALVARWALVIGFLLVGLYLIVRDFLP